MASKYPRQSYDIADGYYIYTWEDGRTEKHPFKFVLGERYEYLSGYVGPRSYSYPPPIHEMFVNRERTEINFGAITGYSGTLQIQYIGSFDSFMPNPGVGPTPPDVTRMLNVLGNKLVSALSGASTGLAFAESKKTSDMILKRVSSVLSAARQLRKGNIVGAARSLGVEPPKNSAKMTKRLRQTYGKPSYGRAVRDSWLELQYGWLPLYKDVYDTMEVYHKRLQAGKVINSITKTIEETTTASGTASGGLWGQKLSTTQFVKHRIKLKKKAYYSERCHTTRNFQQLGFLNPGIIWEMIPFSFVADAFVPFGQYLDAQTATAGLDFQSGFTSREDTYDNQMNGSHGSYHKTWIKYWRWHDYDFPNYSLVLKTPGPLSATNICAAISTLLLP